MERRDQSMTANVPPAPIEALSVPARQVAPRLRGHTELPSAWSDLKCGDYVRSTGTAPMLAVEKLMTRPTTRPSFGSSSTMGGAGPYATSRTDFHQS